MERRRVAHDDLAPRKRFRGAANGAGLTVTVLSFAVAVELTCRLDDWFRYGTPIDSPVVSVNGLVMVDSTGPHGRPFARYTKFILNNLGMRGPDVPAAKAPGILRVVTLGASETFGLYESLGHEYPRQLEDSLRACGKFQVVNAALIGMSLPTEDRYLRLRVAALHPDVVVLYPSPAQYLVDSVPTATPSGTTTGAGESINWFQLRVTRRLADRLATLIPARVRNYFRRRALDDSVRAWRFKGLATARLAQFDSELRHIIGTIRDIGAQPIVMTHADVFMAKGPANEILIDQWRQFYPHATGTTLLEFDSAAAVATRHIADSVAVPLVDFAAIVRGQLPDPPASYFGDYEHFTDKGAGLVAELLAPKVLSVAGIPCVSFKP
jgi:hypothetical protein